MAAGGSETQGKLPTKCDVRGVNEKFIVTQIKAKMDEIFRNKIEASCSSEIESGHQQSKSYEFAERFQKSGRRSLKKKKYRESTIRYTKCIALAPADYEYLALAYAGRSEGLFHLGQYEASLLDANRAIKEGCTNRLNKLLRRRKIDCLRLRRQEKIGANEISIDAIDPADLILAENLTDSERRVFVADWLFESQNPFLPETSSKVGLVYNNESRPTMVAKEDIEAGDFLSIEELSILALDFDRRFYHCAYCLGRCDCLIPCPTCSEVMYCCDFCRSEADKRFHRTECQLLHFLNRKRVHTYQRDMIALRTFLMATNQGRGLGDLMKKLKFDDIIRKNPGSSKVPFVNDYFSALDFMRKRKELDNEKLFQIMEQNLPSAIDAIIALRSISFFGTNSPRKCLNESEQFSTLLLVKNYMLEGLFTIFTQSRKSFPAEHRIGTGVDFFHNFFKSSCNPNTSAFVEGRHRVAYATRSIKAGEQLFFNYRHFYMYHSIEDRKRMGGCRCEACLKKWPSIDGMRVRPIEFLNDTTSAALIDSMNGLTQDHPLEQEIDVFPILVNLIELLCKSLKMPSYDIFMCEELLITCMNTYFSDFHWSGHSDDQYLIDEFQELFFMIITRLRRIKGVTRV